MVKQKAPGLKQIELCADGKYRWIYEFNMLKNPTIFFTVLNIFGVLILVQVFLMVILGLKDGDSLLDALKSAGTVALVMLAIFFVLTLLGYLVVAARYNWKYVVLFEMDHEGILHRQLKDQVKKERWAGLQRWWVRLVEASQRRVQEYWLPPRSRVTQHFRQCEA